MKPGYMVVARDGKEYGPLDRDTVQQWYYEGRIVGSSLVYEPGGNKFRLHEMFDLSVWNDPKLVAQVAAKSADSAREFVPKSIEDLTSTADARTPGMLAAGILLIINGVMGLLSLVVIATVGADFKGGSSSVVVPFVDLVVASGLLRGKEKYRRWGLLRSIVGAFFFTVITLANGPSVNSVFIMVFQLAFCAGMAALLWGDWPSKVRVGAGVAAVLVAWSGIITTEFIAGFIKGFNEQRELARYSLQSAGFEDTRLGIKLRLPEGWSLLSKDNPLVKLPQAEMIVAHNSSGCLAALLVEPRNGVTDLDDYLSLVLKNRQQIASNVRELSRQDVQFGSSPGRRLETAWSQTGNRFRGFSTVRAVGRQFYLLTGWCVDGSYSNAIRQFESLEKAFEINIPVATESIEITSESETDSVDLVFCITDHRTLADGSQSILCRGIHEGEQVSFELWLGQQWQSSTIKEGISDFSGKARYRSVGIASDNFVRVLDQLYSTGLRTKQMKKEIAFDAISLQGDPRNPDRELVMLKLFFQSPRSDQYAEFYTNIDLSERKLYMSEKDSDYRSAIVRALRAR